ncbi:MAG: DNA alkylation repair protein, partial [Candidatus Rifleibacteriota bacterium]
IYSRALEEKPELVLPVLNKWNTSDNPWKRRQSVVSLLYYSRLRKKVLPYKVMIKMVKNLLDDKAYYVQKGIGWTIREIYNCYPELTISFIKNHIKQIAPAAWQATSEKLPKDLRKKLVKQRRQA